MSNAGVLVVDDDQVILELLAVVLRRAGFTVLLASNGARGIELYKQHRESIDVVLLDVQMAGMDGPQTLAAIQILAPDVRCCFMSGDIGKYSPDDLLARGAARILSKPFLSLSELGQTLLQIARHRPQATATGANEHIMTGRHGSISPSAPEPASV